MACTQQKEGREYDAVFADSIAKKVYYYNNNGQRHKSIPYIDSAFAKLLQPGLGDLCKKYYLKAEFYYSLNRNTDNLSTALIFCDSLLDLLNTPAKRKWHKQDYEGVIYIKGYTQILLKRYSDAYRTYYEGLKQVKWFEDTCMIGRFYGQLGSVLYGQEKFSEAIEYFKQSNSYTLICNTASFEGRQHIHGMLSNIGLAFEKNNQPDSAIAYAAKAVDACKLLAADYDSLVSPNFGDMALGTDYGNMGGAYLQKGMLDSAQPLLQKSVAINIKRGYYNNDAATALIKLAELYLATAQLSRADTVLLQARSILNRLPDPPVEARWMKWENVYLEKTRQFEAAYMLSKDYNQLENVLHADKKYFVGNDFVKEFAALERQDNLNDLKSQNIRDNFYLLIALITIPLLITIVLLVWQNNKKKTKNAGLLKENIKYLNHTLEGMEQSNREYGQLLKIVAHDLRNPIGAIASISNLMLMDNRTEDDREMLTLIDNSTKNLLILISGLLESNFDNSYKNMAKEPFDVEELLEECTSLLQYKASEKMQQLKMHAPANITLQANREKLWRVINNLVINAIKFSPQKTEIALLAECKGKQVLIMIKDNGMGIPKEMQGHLFSLQSNARRAGTLGEPSFGMGLYISKQIIVAHGGKIWLQSEPGKGSTFYIELPLENDL